MPLKKLLRATLTASGLSVPGIAHVASVSEAELRDFATGKGDLTLAAVGRILDALGLRLTRIAGEFEFREKRDVWP